MSHLPRSAPVALLAASILGAQPAGSPAAQRERIPVAAPTARLRTGAAEPLVGGLRVPAGRPR